METGEEDDPHDEVSSWVGNMPTQDSADGEEQHKDEEAKEKRKDR